MDTLSVDDTWRALLLSGVAAHVPLEPGLNPQAHSQPSKHQLLMSACR